MDTWLTPERSTVDSDARSPTHRVLIVDDSVPITQLLATCLADLARVETAHSGVAGLERAVTFNPNVLIVDIMLPGMSGFDLVETLRRRHGGLAAPVIFVTGLQEPANIRRAKQLGALAVLHKPLNAEGVRSLVLKALLGARA